MTSARKIAANKANARHSSGPKTARGRSRAARNALRHGLNVAISKNSSASKEAEALAREIAGTAADQALLALARRVAGAQLDLARIRKVRDDFIAELLADCYLNTRAANLKAIANIRAVLRGNFEGDGSLDDLVPAELNHVDKIATIMLTKLHALQSLDRYERRAASRRKFAIRELDAVRRSRRC